MTMYFSPGYSEVVVEDPFVLDHEKGRLFAGAVQIGQIFIPNFIHVSLCYALGPNRHLVISPGGIVLFVNGEPTASLGCDCEYVSTSSGLSHQSRGGKIDLDNEHHRVKKLWSRTNDIISRHYQSSEETKLIRNAVQEWETSSKATLKLLKRNIANLNSRRGKTEIWVSGTYWLIHHRDEARLVIGESDDALGWVSAPSKWDTIRMATPIRDGWVIKASTADWIVQRKSNGVVELQEFFCPYGEWTMHGRWVFWDWEHVILSPIGHVSPVPRELFVFGATSRWAFCYLGRPRDDKIVVLNEKGDAFYVGAMQDLYPGYMDLWPGDSSVLVWQKEREYYYCSMIPESRLPLPRHSWKMAVLPSSIKLRGNVIRGKPDTFVILFESFSKLGWGICLISTERKAWWIFFPEERPLISSSEKVLVRDLDDGQIELIVQTAKKEDPPKIKLEVSGDSVQLDRNWPVAITGEMTTLPHHETALLERLMPFLKS